jgi:hypothetical protein
MITGAIPANHIDGIETQRSRTGPPQQPPEGRVSPTPRRWAMAGEDVPQDDERASGKATSTALAQTPTSSLPLRLASPRMAKLRKRGLISPKAVRNVREAADTTTPNMSAD